MDWMIWTFAALAAAVYCIARGILDIRRKQYVWGAAGIISAAVFLLMPVQTHAVRVDLPAPDAR